MPDSDHFRHLARRCRVLSKSTIEPEVTEQLRVWAADFAEEADEVERRTEETGAAYGEHC